jgi:hypothetical protein
MAKFGAKKTAMPGRARLRVDLGVSQPVVPTTHGTPAATRAQDVRHDRRRAP